MDVKAEEVADGKFTVNDGITFVRAVINTLDCKVHQERIKQPTGFKSDDSSDKPYRRPLWIKEGRRMDQIYEFDSNHTLIINPCGYIFDGLAYTYFNEDLAKAWGILDKEGKLYGPSVRFLYKDQHVLNDAGDVASTLTYTDSTGTKTKVVQLNARVRWEIMKMNTGLFESTFLPESKTLRVYSYACDSGFVGNQRVDVFKAIHGLAPKYISDLVVIKSSTYNLRSADSLFLSVPHINTKKTLGDRAFTIAAPKLWNSLPVELRQINSIFAFKRQLKSYLFQLAYC